MSKMIQITETSDLLKAEPIFNQVANFGIGQVENEIAKSVNKCIRGLGIEISQRDTKLLIEDIVDNYKFDSIEDVQECLKKGRQGYYGKIYGKLNMIVFSEWMSKHLEEKAIAREHQNNDKYKHNWESKEDYIKAVETGLKEQEKEQSRSRRERIANEEYERFKAAYEAKRPKNILTIGAKIKLNDGSILTIKSLEIDSVICEERKGYINKLDIQEII